MKIKDRDRKDKLQNSKNKKIRMKSNNKQKRISNKSQIINKKLMTQNS